MSKTLILQGCNGPNSLLLPCPSYLNQSHWRVTNDANCSTNARSAHWGATGDFWTEKWHQESDLLEDLSVSDGQEELELEGGRYVSSVYNSQVEGVKVLSSPA